MNIKDENPERIENLKRKIEDVIRKNFPEFSESGNGAICSLLHIFQSEQ